MLQYVGGKASNMQMMKWAFLLSRETPSHGGKTFYEFIPYRYGPYSFTLNQEKDTLIRNDFLEKDSNNHWILTYYGKNIELNLPNKIGKDIDQILTIYGDLSGKQLRNVVYEKYSWFTINSILPGIRREERPVADKYIYTAGYEKKSVDEFLNLLLESGISQLIDVRYNPISRRYGFHKSTLSRLCKSLGIEYQHFPSLGIPSSERRSLDSGDQHESLFKKYRRNLPSHENDLIIVSHLLNSKPSVLVCMEAEPKFCHRNVLAQYLTNTTDLPVKHLGLSV